MSDVRAGMNMFIQFLLKNAIIANQSGDRLLVVDELGYKMDNLGENERLWEGGDTDWVDWHRTVAIFPRYLRVR